MSIIVFISKTAILFFLGIVVIVGLKEKKNLFELFIQGTYDGVKVVWELFPTLLALLVSVGMLNCSGFINYLSTFFYPIFKLIRSSKRIDSINSIKTNIW